MTAVALVYILRSGNDGDHMVGWTAKILEERLKEHHTSNPHLVPIHVIETETNAAATSCEAYLKGFLQSKRLPGSSEFFSRSAPEADEAAKEVRRFLNEDLPNQKAVARFSQESDGTIIAPGDADWEAYRRLMVAREVEYRAGAERARFENQLKLRMGRAAAIQGVATWRVHTETKFRESEFKTAYPEMWKGVQAPETEASLPSVVTRSAGFLAEDASIDSPCRRRDRLASLRAPSLTTHDRFAYWPSGREPSWLPQRDVGPCQAGHSSGWTEQCWEDLASAPSGLGTE